MKDAISVILSKYTVITIKLIGSLNIILHFQI